MPEAPRIILPGQQSIPSGQIQTGISNDGKLIVVSINYPNMCMVQMPFDEASYDNLLDMLAKTKGMALKKRMELRIQGALANETEIVLDV